MAELLEELPRLPASTSTSRPSGAVAAAGRPRSTHRRAGPGLRRLVLRRRLRRVPPADRRRGSQPRRRRPRSRVFIALPSAARPARVTRRRRRRPPGAAPRDRSRSSRRARTTGARGRRPRARLDGRRARRDGRAARPGCRRPDHRPDGHTQGRADRARPVEDTSMSGQAPTRHRRPRRRRPAPAAEGLELVRLGQLGVLHDGRFGAVRAVHDHGGWQGRRLCRPRRDLQQDRRACWASTWPPAPCPAT